MAKNGKGGKKFKRKKKEGIEKTDLTTKEKQQEYAKVTKMLGNCRIEAQCFDGVKRLCVIRGTMRKKVWIKEGDIILVGLREYQDDKADVILKYSDQEVRRLNSYGHLDSIEKINDEKEEEAFVFEDTEQFNFEKL